MKDHTTMTPNDPKNTSDTNNSSEQQQQPEQPGQNQQSLSGNVAVSNGSTNVVEADFSEFLWMEHEDEFDEQVLQELLEEEEIQNFYYNLTEAENEFDARVPRFDDVHATAQPGNPPTNPNSTSGQQGGDPLMQQITSGLSQMGFTSRFNPNAAEFVPRMTQSERTSSSIRASSGGNKS